MKNTKLLIFVLFIAYKGLFLTGIKFERNYYLTEYEQFDACSDEQICVYPENSANVIILEKGKYLYDYKIYEFLLDKKIIIDFTLFLFEFITGDSIKCNNMDDLVKKINDISINNEIYFFNKKMRFQKRSMIQSLNIVENIISKEKN